MNALVVDDEALALLDAGAWALVFCDVRLGDGGQDGFDVLRRFNEAQPEAQIVLMTGHGSAIGALDAVSSGAYEYLLKPFDIDDVRAIAQSVRAGRERRAAPRTTGELPALSAHSSDIELVGRSGSF